MKISLTTCVFIFILGWFGGSLFVLVFFGLNGFSDNLHIPKQSITMVRQNIMRTVDGGYFFRRHTVSPTVVTTLHRLPNFNASSEGTDQTWIFMDWPVDDRLFTVENYKALESILTIYPKSSIRCRVAASTDIYRHKIGNLLSFTQFAKYAKRQYDIQVIPVNVKQKSMISHIAEAYRSKWLTACCSRCSDTSYRTGDRVQPYHLLNFLRLSSLYVKGGIFTDFSFFFLGQLDAPLVNQGFYINSYCARRSRIEEWQRQEERDQAEGYGSGSGAGSGNCVSSTLLVFHERRSDVVLCALTKYEDPIFLNCVESDGIYGGAQCVAVALEECFAKHGAANDLVAGVTATTAMALGMKTSRATSTISSASSSSSSSSEPTTVLRSGAALMETFDNNPHRAANTLLSSNWSIEHSTRVVWLGSLAWTGSWRHHPYPNGTLIHEIVHRVALNAAPGGAGGDQREGGAKEDDQYRERTDSNAITNSDGETTCGKPMVCHHYSKYHQAQTAVGNTSSVDEVGAPSRLVTVSLNTGIEEASCAPGVVVAGFLRSASSFLFNALTNHPQLLPALRGPQFKEPYCYSHDHRQQQQQQQLGGGSSSSAKLQMRPWCFPFVEQGEAVMSVDGSVGYSSDPLVPHTLKQDNPAVKVLFVVRNPVDRLYSAYRGARATLDSSELSGAGATMAEGSFDDFLERGVELGGLYADLRQMTTNGTAPGRVIRHYYSQQQQQSQSPHIRMGGIGNDVLFMHSLYYPAVLHYVRVLGRDSVLVVNGDDLDRGDTARLRSTLAQVFRFVGLCMPPGLVRSVVDSEVADTDSIARADRTDRRTGRDGSGADEMSQDMYAKLSVFFAPFNAQLANLTASGVVAAANGEAGGLNISHWSTAPPPSSLPRFSPGLNCSRPRLWFESRLWGDNYHGQLVPHLLPQRKSREDSGGNTTLGMLNSF